MSLPALTPGMSMSMSQLRHTVQMRERVAEACHLVESHKNVRTVHIVTTRQPAGGELQRYQEYAAWCHVSLAVDTHGMISIRPGAGEDA